MKNNKEITLNELQEKILKRKKRTCDTVIERKWRLSEEKNAILTARPLRPGEDFVRGIRRIANGYVYETVVRIKKEALAVTESNEE